jgi:hypothetical protein
VKLVLQRGQGDCAVAAVATLAAKLDAEHRGRNGMHLARIVALGKRLGVILKVKRRLDLETDEGLLVVRWQRRRKNRLHLVVLAHGVIVDPADGQILPPDEYFVRAHAAPDAFLEVT